MNPTRIVAAFLAAILAFHEAASLEANFAPTETEWTLWPSYCRARYVVSGAGRNTLYTRRVPASEVASQQRAIGDRAWAWLHHYCAGLIYMDRAKATTDARVSAHLLANAQEEFVGQYERVPPEDPFFAVLVTTMARLYREQGLTEEALAILAEGIAAQPSAPSPYAFAGLILREEHRLDEAKQMLLAGNEAVNGRSAEIHYFLGLILIDVGDIDGAAEHAQQAYALGYPLPGLREKLRRLGKTAH